MQRILIHLLTSTMAAVATVVIRQMMMCCSTDANNDGAVNVTDLLMLLGEFGLECE